MHPLELPRLLADIESRSVLDVQDVGAWKYAEHPTTEFMSLAFKLRHTSNLTKIIAWSPEKEALWRPDETQLWTPGLPFPEALIDMIKSGEVLFEAHNTQFEMAMFLRILHQRLGLCPMPRVWADTMAVCAYRSLPLGLDNVGEVLNLPIKKDKRGRDILNKLSKPRRPLKADKKRFAEMGLAEEDWPLLWHEDWQLYEDLYDYNIQDIEAEESLGDTLGDLPPDEYTMWVLDQKINYRGLYVDSEAVEAAIGIVELIVGRAEAELQQITDGKIESGNQVKVIKEWLNDHGVEIPNVQADTVDQWVEILDNQITDGVEDPEVIAPLLRVLEIRQMVSSASVKKLYKFRECLCDDGYVRGLLQYHGAGTGRWSGRLVQPQNFPRGILEDYVEKFGLEDNDDGPSIVMEILIECIKLRGQDAIDMLEMFFGNVMKALATSLRGMFIPAPGKKYRVADFSAIEAAVTSWLAGEEWKLDAFRIIQRGEKYNGADDIYCATASKILGRLITKKDKAERQKFGKVPELAFGYQGGVGAWHNFDKRTTMADSEIDEIKYQWRDEHPATRRLWYGLENAAVSALQLDKAVRYRYIVFQPVYDAAGKWLTAILPNGRRLWYFNPQLEYNGKWRGEDQYQVSYEGRDNKNNRPWARIRTYGGMLTENVVQAISRDLMAEAMVRVEKAGYEIVLTVHDEIIVENDEDFGSQEEFEHLMSIVPKWAEGCPVGVAGWEGYRYRKD